jgi:hypothetical protein
MKQDQQIPYKLQLPNHTILGPKRWYNLKTQNYNSIKLGSTTSTMNIEDCYLASLSCTFPKKRPHEPLTVTFFTYKFILINKARSEKLGKKKCFELRRWKGQLDKIVCLLHK